MMRVCMILRGDRPDESLILRGDRKPDESLILSLMRA
jgi:hypothetical protein